MKLSIKKGFSFGLTSGIITTLGVMVGLHEGTSSRLAVLGGILMVAIADSMSDALGMHVSEEAENYHSTKEIWESTIATMFTKFIIAATFIIPVIIFKLPTAIIISIVWGLLLLTVFSWRIAQERKKSPKGIIFEHVLIALAVIVITYFVGNIISAVF